MARELDIVVTADTAQAEQALGRVDDAVRKVGTSSIDTGKAVEDAEKMVDKNIAALEKKWKEQERAATSAEKATQRQTAAMGPLEAAVRRFAAPAAIGLAIKSTLTYADAIQNLSKQTGIAPGKLQALEFSAKQVGLSLDPVVQSIGVMSDKIASGDKSAVAALGRLGFTLDGIRDRNPDEAFLDIAKAVAAVKNPMDQAALATDIFGRTGLRLLPLLKSDIEQLMKKARELGLVMTDETAKAAADLNTNLSNMIDIGKRLIMVFFEPLLPLLNPIATGLGYLSAQLAAMIQTILSPGDNIAKFVAELKSAAEYLGIIAGYGAGPLPFVGHAGGMPLPGGPAIPGYDFSGWTQGGGLPTPARPPRSSNVLPFERRFNNSMVGTPWQGYESPALGAWQSSFPGWYQAPLNGAFEGGLPWAPYAGTVGMNAPGGDGASLWSKLSTGRMGSMLGGLGGMLTGMIPGMSGRGSSIGSTIGGFLGPLGGLLGGLGGGLIGKLFGGGGAARDARNSFVGDFGGMGALRTAAGSAGVSLDALMNAKKVEDVDREIKKLTESIGAYEQKLADANDELDTMRGSLDDVIAKGADLGYNFDKSGELVSVNFKKMQEVAEKYGLSLDTLGPAFQKQRLHDAAMQIVNDFELLNKGGTDTGTILLGMSDKINALVNESIKFGVDIPANMKPYIQNLIDAGKLVDENGVAITDLGQIKFGDSMATEFEKITSSLNDLVTKIGELVSKLDEMTRPRTVQIDYNVEPPPDILTPDYNSRGGLVPYPKYLAGGGFIPRGTDTVPAMLTPGEGVMRREAVSRLMRGDWPQGGGTQVSIGNLVISDQDDERRVGKAVLTAVKRKRRLNAA